MKKIVLFASGSGSNVENIVNHFKENDSVIVESVFTNNPKAGVIERCERLKIPCHLFTKTEFSDGTVLNALSEWNPDLIVLAGFLLLVPRSLVEAFPNRIINIHPALLPKYGGKGMYGMHVHQAVADNCEAETGITIHYVNEHFDDGEIIFQAQVEVGEYEATVVAEQVQELEHKYFPLIIENLLLG